MKKLVFFIIIFSLSKPLYSQESFFRYFPTSTFEVPKSAVETPDDKYIIVGDYGLTYNDGYHGFILKLFSDGTIEDSRKFQSKTHTSSFSTIDHYSSSLTNYLITGYSDSIADKDRYSKMLLYRVNDSLQMVEEHCFPSEVNRCYKPWQTEIVDDSILYILNTYYDYTLGRNSIQKLAVSKFRLPVDSIMSYHIEEGQNMLCIAQDLIYLKDMHKLNILYFGNTISKSSALNILELTDSLKYIRTLPGPERIFSNACATKYSDTSYLITGVADGLIYPPKQHILVYLMDNMDDTLKKLEYYNNPDTILYTGGKINTAISGNSIFVAGVYNIDPLHYPLQSTPIWVQITRTDMGLNIISQHFYGGDPVYMPYSIISTSDDGAFITGFRWDYNTPYDLQFDVFVLKSDANGVIIDIPKNVTWQASEAILCPNPGSDYCIAVVGPQYCVPPLTLFDLNSKPVIAQDLYQSSTRINTSSLAPGFYAYRFYSGQKLIGQGKWVKQ